MIVRITFVNSLPHSILVESNQASDQPLEAGQSLQITTELHEGPGGVADLRLGVKEDYDAT